MIGAELGHSAHKVNSAKRTTIYFQDTITCNFKEKLQVVVFPCPWSTRPSDVLLERPEILKAAHGAATTIVELSG